MLVTPLNFQSIHWILPPNGHVCSICEFLYKMVKIAVFLLHWMTINYINVRILERKHKIDPWKNPKILKFCLKGTNLKKIQLLKEKKIFRRRWVYLFWVLCPFNWNFIFSVERHRLLHASNDNIQSGYSSVTHRIIIIYNIHNFFYI